MLYTICQRAKGLLILGHLHRATSQERSLHLNKNMCAFLCLLGVTNPVRIAGELARQSREPMALGRVRPM